jgi:hypothetical protein
MSNTLLVFSIIGLVMLVYAAVAARAYLRTRGARGLSHPVSQPADQPASADGPVTFAVLRQWYEGKSCCVCQRAIGPLHHSGPQPALKSPESEGHEILTWKDIPPAHRRAALATHAAVCASCQIAEDFRKQYPDLVTDRRDRTPPSATIH